MPDGLRHVILGILAGGIPAFRMVLLLLRSPPGMALWLCFSSLLFLLPYLVKMIQCYHSCINYMKVYGYTRCAVTMFGLECMLQFYFGICIQIAG